jgi:hypothetical protein
MKNGYVEWNVGVERLHTMHYCCSWIRFRRGAREAGRLTIDILRDTFNKLLAQISTHYRLLIRGSHRIC